MWRLMPGQSLHYRGWDDEFVLYNDWSGATHLLGAAALTLLQALQQGGAGQAALAALLGLDADPDSEAQLALLLAELEALHLIVDAPC